MNQDSSINEPLKYLSEEERERLEKKRKAVLESVAKHIEIYKEKGQEALLKALDIEMRVRETDLHDQSS